MNVLLSAYACEPERGSEPEVGWRWVLEMSKHHRVAVITRANNKPVIDLYLKNRPGLCENVEFIYFDLPSWALKLKKRSNVLNWYYVFWQFRARKKIDQIISEKAIELVHLVTFASFRYPVFLRNLAVPVVWGPVGGAEVASWSLLFHRVRFPECIKEVGRNLSTYISSYCVKWVDPTTSSGGIALASTPRTQLILKKRGIFSIMMPTIGVDLNELDHVAPPSTNGNEVKFLYVGRLVLLKGVHLLIEAFARAEMTNARLTLVGSGTQREWLKKMVEDYGISDRVNFTDHVAKESLPVYYQQHDVLVAPSLYESGGYMVLEAFQHERPAIVLDIGGPALSVDARCGIKVPVGKSSQVIEGLSEAMNFYQDNRHLIIDHGKAGRIKVEAYYNWNSKSRKMASVYYEAVEMRNIEGN